MKAIKVTDSFADIISRFEKESAKTRGAIKTLRIYKIVNIVLLILIAIKILPSA